MEIYRSETQYCIVSKEVSKQSDKLKKKTMIKASQKSKEVLFKRFPMKKVRFTIARTQTHTKTRKNYRAGLKR